LDGENENLLRVLKSQRAGSWTQSFDTPQYFSITKSEIRDLEIHIKDVKGNFASFLKKPVTITLHFRQYPFLS